MRMCMLAGANSIHSSRWIEFFARRGHEIRWVSLAPFAGPAPARVQTYEVAPRRVPGVQILAAVRMLRGLCREVRPALLHVHSVGTYGLTAALTGFHPLVATAWGSDVLIAGRSRVKGPLVRFALDRADVVTCDAEHMRRAMIRLGVREEKIQIVYFGTDTARFRPRPKSAELRRELGIADAPMVISLRSLEPIYDVESLIRAVPPVVRQVPEATFVVVGTGSERERLGQLAESLGISGHVRFTGQIPNHRLPEYLASADLYVSTSLSDAGLAASTAEAMACGLPVVVTDSGENRLWVKDGEGGFVVPVKAPDAVSAKILYLLQHRVERDRFGRWNRSLIEERNSYDVEMEKMEKLYEQLARRHGAR